MALAGDFKSVDDDGRAVGSKSVHRRRGCEYGEWLAREERTVTADIVYRACSYRQNAVNVCTHRFDFFHLFHTGDFHIVVHAHLHEKTFLKQAFGKSARNHKRIFVGDEKYMRREIVFFEQFSRSCEITVSNLQRFKVANVLFSARATFHSLLKSNQIHVFILRKS